MHLVTTALHVKVGNTRVNYLSLDECKWEGCSPSIIQIKYIHD